MQKRRISKAALIQLKIWNTSLNRRCGAYFSSIKTINPNPCSICKRFGLYCFGGGGGSRTRVRKPIHIYFSGCRLLFKLPACGRRQPSRRKRYLPDTMAVRKKLPSSFTVNRRPNPKPRYSSAGRQA